MLYIDPCITQIISKEGDSPEELSISRDETDRGGYNTPVLLYVPDTGMEDHHHIELTLEESKILHKWLGVYISKKESQMTREQFDKRVCVLSEGDGTVIMHKVYCDYKRYERDEWEKVGLLFTEPVHLGSVVVNVGNVNDEVYMHAYPLEGVDTRKVISLEEAMKLAKDAVYRAVQKRQA